MLLVISTARLFTRLSSEVVLNDIPKLAMQTARDAVRKTIRTSIHELTSNLQCEPEDMLY